MFFDTHLPRPENKENPKKIPLLTTTGAIAALWSFVHGETHLLFFAIAQVEFDDWLRFVELVSEVVSDLSDALSLTVGLPLGGRGPGDLVFRDRD